MRTSDSTHTYVSDYYIWVIIAYALNKSSDKSYKCVFNKALNGSAKKDGTLIVVLSKI